MRRRIRSPLKASQARRRRSRKRARWWGSPRKPADRRPRRCGPAPAGDCTTVGRLPAQRRVPAAPGHERHQRHDGRGLRLGQARLFGLKIWAHELHRPDAEGRRRGAAARPASPSRPCRSPRAAREPRYHRPRRSRASRTRTLPLREKSGYFLPESKRLALKKLHGHFTANPKYSLNARTACDARSSGGDVLVCYLGPNDTHMSPAAAS